MKRSSENTTKIEMLSPSQITASPNQPRKSYDADSLNGLIQSIRKNGIIQPLQVRKVSKDAFELVFGHRRLLAANVLKLESVPCIVSNISTSQSACLALIENIQREKLSYFEEADAISRLIREYNMTQCEISLCLGMSQPTVANKLRLLRLSPRQRQRISDNRLTARHARALLRLEDEIEREKALDEIIVRGLNVDQTDKLVEKMLVPPKQPMQRFVVNDIRFFVNSINKAINIMKISGIDAKSQRQEDEDFIKYTVLIPKKK